MENGMNEQERSALDRLISIAGALDAKASATNAHLSNLNGSISKHFADDLAWQQEHDKREAETKGFRRGLLLPLGVLVTVTSIVGPVIAKLTLGG